MWVRKPGEPKQVSLYAKLDWFTIGFAGLRMLDVICDKCQRITEELPEFDPKCSCGGKRDLLTNWHWIPDPSNPSLTPPPRPDHKERKVLVIFFGAFVAGIVVAYILTGQYSNLKESLRVLFG